MRSRRPVPGAEDALGQTFVEFVQRFDAPVCITKEPYETYVEP